MCDEGLNLDRCETEQKNKNSNTYMMASVKTNDSKASRTSKILKYHEMTWNAQWSLVVAVRGWNPDKSCMARIFGTHSATKAVIRRRSDWPGPVTDRQRVLVFVWLTLSVNPKISKLPCCCLAIDVWIMFKMMFSFLLSLLLKTNKCLNDVCMMSKSCLNEFLMIYEDVWLCHQKLFILSKMMSEWCVNDVLIMFGWCPWSTIFES